MKAAWMAGVCAILIVAAQPSRAVAGAQAKPNPSVTLTGCLYVDGTQFKMSELEGAQAPKGRNWKTAFITKTTKDVDVVGASSAVRLQDHIGHKITVTGAKSDDTHLTARSIKHVAPSCS